MTDSNLSIGNWNPNIKPLENEKQKDETNATNLLKQDVQPDTVEINGDVKTLDNPDNKKKKKFKLETPQILAAAGVATALIATGIATLRAVKKGGRFRMVPFSHKPLMPQMPTLKELDAHIADTVKNIPLSYGYIPEHAQDAKTIAKYLEAYAYPDACQKLGERAAKDPEFKQILRILTGSNFSVDYTKGTKGPFDKYDISYKTAITDIDTSKIKAKDIETLFKYLIAKNNANINNNKIMNWDVLPLLKKEPKNSLRIMSLCDKVNELYKTKQGTSAYFKLDSLSILKYNPELSSKDMYVLVKALKEGSLVNFFGRSVDLSNLSRLLESKNTDIKKVTNIYSKLNDKAIEHISLDTLNQVVEEFKPSEAINKINAIPEKTLEKMDNGNDVLTYLRFEDYVGKNNINELSQAEKKKLMEKLVKNNVNSFGYRGSSLGPLIPTTQKEYCNLLNKLAKSIGIDTKPLTAQQKAFFEQGLHNLDNSIKGVDFNKVELELKIPRSVFVTKVTEAMKNLEPLEQRKVMDYYGFEIENGVLKGYPINLNNGDKLSEIASMKTRKVVENIRPLVIEFSEKNPIKVTNASADFEKDLNDILQGLPEFRPMIGKVQHKTHAYTLDKHTLKVLQGVVSNPKFQNLSTEDKKILSIASLLHDITKTEGVRDLAHPMESAFDAFYIIQKMNLPEEQQLKIYELIKSHNWLDRLNNPKNTPEMVQQIAQDIAFDSRHTNTFELAKILCEADMKAVKKDSTFFEHHKKTLEQMSNLVDRYIKRIHTTQIVLPQTVIPKASQITGGVTKSADGIKNTVIYMNNVGNDLSAYGFAKGTTKENWRGLVHALEEESQMSKFNTFSTIDTEALLSTSYMDTKSYKVFRKQGFILDVNTNDIHAGYCSDFGTGYEKSIELLKSDYLFHGQRKANELERNAWRSDRSRYRNYIPDLIKKAMGVNDEEYMKLLEKIQGCKSLTDIEKVDKKFAEKLKQVFEEMESRKRSGGRQYNEMLVSRPKIQGVFAYDKPYERIPKFLRKYAQENDIPIIIFGKPQ